MGMSVNRGRPEVAGARQNDAIDGPKADLRPNDPPPGGKGQHTFKCFECERPDPLKTDQVMGWLKDELQPPK